MKRKNYYSKNNMAICAGGILFYDDVGIYVIKEKNIDYQYLNLHPYRYNDPGGKYSYEDTDIDVCITREFNEETYYSYHDIMNFDVLKRLISDRKVHEVYLTKTTWIYKCYLIHISHVGITFFDNKKFFINRLVTLNHNKLYQYYTSVEYLRLPYSELRDNDKLSSRLLEILRESFLNKHL